MKSAVLTRGSIALVVIAALVWPAFVAAADTTVRIGYQRSSTLMTLLRDSGTLDERLAARDIALDWHEFNSGPPMLEALNTGSIDLTADVADTVPIFAQAAGADLVFYATEAPSPSGQALIAHADSGIESLADLQDKSVAVTRGSGNHYLWLAAVEQAGLDADDFDLRFLEPQDASAAFARHNVDAWIPWEPYLSAARARSQTKTLLDGRDGLADYRRFYLASGDFARRHPEALDTVYTALAEKGAWLRQHRHAAAERLSPIWGGMDIAVVRDALANRSYRVEPVSKDLFAEQQRIADAFAQAGVLPAPVDTRAAAIWRPGPQSASGVAYE